MQKRNKSKGNGINERKLNLFSFSITLNQKLVATRFRLIARDKVKSVTTAQRAGRRN